MTQPMMSMIIDDDPAIRESLEQWLELADIKVSTFARAELALDQLPPDFPGVIVSDVKMPGMDGMQLLAKVPSDIPVILITGHGDIAMAVDAMRQGAFDFVEKPYNPEQLVIKVKRACEQRLENLKNQDIQSRLQQLQGLEARIIGKSPAIVKLREQIIELARVNADIMVFGETGTGKELVAQCLHDLSSRSDGAFVPVNVAAIPESLFESEMFGHEAGAFTGAQKRHIGKFEYADGGSLFLDEIESMPIHFQVKVLRALQEREVIRVGSNAKNHVDIRVISATKEDLKGSDNFREDLYYRLMVAELHIPPLRERKEDLPLVFTHYLNIAAEKHHLPIPELATDDWLSLELYDWPGNIRELKHSAERFLLTRQMGQVSLKEMIQFKKPEAEAKVSLGDRMDQVEKLLISAELKKQRGNIKATMEALDLPRRTLNQKMQKYGLRRDDYIMPES